MVPVFLFLGDFLQREGRAQQIHGEPPAPLHIVGGDGFLSGVEAEAAVFPPEQLAGFLCADEFECSYRGILPLQDAGIQPDVPPAEPPIDRNQQFLL